MRAALSFVLLAVSSIVAGAQTPRTAADELTALEHRWVDAIVKADVATLDKILATTYVDTDEEGGRGTKTDVLAVLRSGDLRFQRITLSGIQVHEYSAAAVVTGTAAQRGAFKGKPVAATVVFTDTFVRTPTGWVVVASQRTAVH